MTAPIQLQCLPPRRKPATKRAFFMWVWAVIFVIGCAGLIARCAPFVM